MLFPTYSFLIFFILTFSLGISLKKQVDLYKAFLLLVNLIFYSFWGLNFLSGLLISIGINYGILWGLKNNSKFSKFWLILGITFNILYLGTFKYYNFFVDSLLAIFDFLPPVSNFQPLEILVPVGVSFYTFRMISHLVDCYRKILAFPRWIDYIIYISYFPQIAAGPIARAKEFYKQLNSSQKYDYKIEEVIVLILSGLFKKYTLSSFLFNFTQLPFSDPSSYSRWDLILAAISYSCLIYVDFSGYSDLSNAISSVFGFRPIQNFNSPYRAFSLQEFWHRWHISLSEWLRDYLYIPLGGNRRGKIRKYFNIFLTFLIGGFWHGAGLNFIVWGGLHGLGLGINHYFKEEIYPKINQPQNSIASVLIPIFNWGLTFGFVTVTWIFFQSPNIEIALNFIQGIWNSPVQIIQFNVWQLYLVIFTILVLINFCGEAITLTLIRLLSLKNIFFRVVLISGFVYSILMLGPNSVPPFIYFNF